MRQRKPTRQRRTIHAPVSIRRILIKRVRVETDRSYEDVLQTMRQLIGVFQQPTHRAENIDPQPNAVVNEAARHAAIAAFERQTRAQLGKSDFMLFKELNHGAWLPVFGIRRRITRWIIGNPLIAITLMHHDLSAGLHVPVQLSVMEKESGSGSIIYYDVPSSIAGARAVEVAKAAKVLDQKLRELVVLISGVLLDDHP